jgi:hypothetical protein
MKRRSSGKSGRTRWTASDAEKVLEELDASGQSVAEFALERGLQAVRLSRWRRRLGRTISSVGLVPVTVNGSSAIRVGSRGLVVETASVRIEVHDYDPMTAAWVAELVRLTGVGP